MAADTDPPGTVVFRSKLTVPAGRGLARSRLLGALDGMWRGQLGLVVAPAGSGKTTLAAQYARTRAEATAWLRAERADGDPDRLLRHLSRAVSGALGTRWQPGAGLDGILLALERWTGERALIVVDDVHALDGTPALACLHRLATLTPPAVRLLAVGRSEPAGLDLSRLRLSEELCEITADDLRFRSWEIDRLFREVYGHPLAPETVGQVASRTGGWAAGLQLLHLATNPAANAAGGGVLDLVARSRLLGSYLVANVLDELPPALLAFVRDTAALGLLTAGLCDGLRGGSGSQPVLEELERRQICRPVRGGHRYLPLLQAHLDTDLRRRAHDAGAAEYVRAARLLEGAGAYADALRAYAAAAEWEETARLLRGHGEQVVTEGRSVRWDDVLPAGLVGDDPWLLLDAARRRSAAGQLHPAADLYERADRAAAEPRVRTLARRERAAVLAWSAAAAPPSSGWYAGLWRATRARPLASVGHGSARAAGDAGRCLVDGLAALLAGHASDADALLAGPATAIASCGPIVFLAARLGRLAARLCLGAAPTPEALEAIAVQADVHDLPWFARLARALLALTGRPDVRGEAASVRRDCERDGDDWGALLAGLVETGQRLAHGSEPEEAAERCVLMARRLGAGVLECWARSLLALGLARGGRAEAEQAARGAEAAARNAEVPGARAVALVALSLCAGPGERREETAALAAALLADCGLRAGSPLSAALLPSGAGTEPVRQAGLPHGSVPRRRPASPAELRCFGGFLLLVEGRELDSRGVRPRARATLRLLALHAGKPVHRETLLEALWPDKPPQSARHGLQVAISALRGLLEPGSSRGAARWVVRDGEAYVLALPPGSWQDVREFTRARRGWRQLRGGGDPGAEAAALRQALAAYGGDLLPEDGPAEWVVAERERLRMEAAECATVLGQLELSAGRPAAAAEALERAVRIDPFRDTAWRSLCETYGVVGDMAAAARARREYARLLTDLDVPGPPVSAS